MRLFRPTARQLNGLLIAAFLSVGYALYFRYMVIEQSSVSLACEGGLRTWLCFTRKILLFVFQNGLFGLVALGAAIAQPDPAVDACCSRSRWSRAASGLCFITSRCRRLPPVS